MVRSRPLRLSLLLIVALVAASGIGFLVVDARAPASAPATPPPGRLRVVTYNIRAGLGGLDDVASDLASLTPDLVALQEVERNIPRSRSRDQAGFLGRELGFEWAFAGSFPVEEGEHGIAILSRFPILESEVLRLPQGQGRWPRVALKVRVQTPDGPVRFVCVHLARPRGWPLSNTRARLIQIDALLASLEGDALPVVLAGDFNSLPVSAEAWKLSRQLTPAWNPWRDGWATSFSLEAIGWPAGSIKIDHVFHDERWDNHGTWVAPKGASDHRAVISDLSLK